MRASPRAGSRRDRDGRAWMPQRRSDHRLRGGALTSRPRSSPRGHPCAGEN
jgi:hypothetical protein